MTTKITKTKIAYSKTLNKGKYDALRKQCLLLKHVRDDIWNRFGSINGVGIKNYALVNQYVAEKKYADLNVHATAWKCVVFDTLDNIEANLEAAKEKIRKDINKRKIDDEEKKRLYKLLKYHKWKDDPYLCRKIRHHWKRGHNHTDNQFIVRSDLFRQKEKNGTLWISIPSLVKGKPIWIPLTQLDPLPEKVKGDKTIKGSNLRLILKDDIVEIHYAVDVPTIKNGCGTKTIGVDKGYTEVFVDSDGDKYGVDFESVLSKETEYLNKKYKHLNRLYQIAKKKPEKANTIKNNNLGRKSLNKRLKRHQGKIKTIIYTATHQLHKTANVIVAENLTFQGFNKKFSKKVKRNLSQWTKGVIAESLNSVSKLRCSELHLVNPAYTSQMDSRFGILKGERKRNSFHCFDGVVLQDDHNAAKNVLARYKDPDIRLYTPFKKVKKILQERTASWEEEHLSLQGFNGLPKGSHISTK